MEINDYGDTRLGIVATENVVEGRMGLLTSHSWSTDFGSQTDLPGVKLPVNTTEAAKAKYVIAFAQDNRFLPIYQPNPSFDYALRYGFDQSENAPFAADVYLTHPGVQEGRTIPSGSNCVAFGEGIYTVPSGSYVYSANLLTPGNQLTVADTASDGASEKGKIKYGTSGVIGEVIRFDTATGRLTFKVFD